MPVAVVDISLRVPSPATLKFVGQMILRALGYNPIQIDPRKRAVSIGSIASVSSAIDPVKATP